MASGSKGSVVGVVGGVGRKLYLGFERGVRGLSANSGGEVREREPSSSVILGGTCRTP